MRVFLKESFNIHIIGSSEFLFSFFSTIAYRLENKKWGGKFPIIMNELYQGCLKKENVDGAINEVKIIESKFRNLDLEDVIWDFEDLDKKIPEEYKNTEILNAYDYFITDSGKKLIDVLLETLNDCKKYKTDLEIVKRPI